MSERNHELVASLRAASVFGLISDETIDNKRVLKLLTKADTGPRLWRVEMNNKSLIEGMGFGKEE